jgi:hypothetical protein
MHLKAAACFVVDVALPDELVVVVHGKVDVLLLSALAVDCAPRVTGVFLVGADRFGLQLFVVVEVAPFTSIAGVAEVELA